MIEVKDGTKRQPGELGFFSGIENEDYHATEGVSSSKLGTLIKCPSKYNNVMKRTEAMEFGTAFHTFFLEPDVFDREYGILDEPNGVTKAAKEEKKRYVDHGMKTLKRKEMNALIKMSDAILRDDVSDLLFNPDDEHYVEHSGFWVCEGVLCKFRPDYLVIKNGTAFIIDIKTIDDCDPSNVMSSIAKRAYHRQAAFYIDGLKSVTGIENVMSVHFFVEKPSKSSSMWDGDILKNNVIEALPVTIPEPDLNQGRREYTRAIQNYKRFIENKESHIPGYKGIFELDTWGEDCPMDFAEIGLTHFKQDDQNKLERSEQNE